MVYWLDSTLSNLIYKKYENIIVSQVINREEILLIIIKIKFILFLELDLRVFILVLFFKGTCNYIKLMGHRSL